MLGASSFQSVSILKSHHFVRSSAELPAHVEVAAALLEVDAELTELDEVDNLRSKLTLVGLAELGHSPETDVVTGLDDVTETVDVIRPDDLAGLDPKKPEDFDKLLERTALDVLI